MGAIHGGYERYWLTLTAEQLKFIAQQMADLTLGIPEGDMYKVTKEYWTGTRMTEQRGITGYEEAKGIAAAAANARAQQFNPYGEAEVSEGTNGYTVKFPLADKMVIDAHYIVEKE